MWFSLLFCLFAQTAGPDLFVVENGKQSAGKTLLFEEELRFGGDDDNNTWKGDNTQLAVGENGHIYVADTYLSRVLAYDEQGRFLREIVGQGQGPGQLRALDNVRYLSNGQLLVLATAMGQPARLLYFKPDGTLVREVIPESERILRSSVIDPKGRFLMGTHVSMTAKDTTSLEAVIGMEQLDDVITFDKITRPMDPLKWKERDYLLQFLTMLLEAEYEPKTLAAFDAKGRLYTARSDRYEISRYDSDLKKVEIRIRKTFEPITNDDVFLVHTAEPLVLFFKDMPDVGKHLNPAFIEEWFGRARLPDQKQPLFGLIAMADGGLLAIHDIDKATGNQLAHIFSEEGRFLGEVRMPRQAFLNASGEARMVFKNGYAYTLESVKKVHRVVRYRVRLVDAE